MATLIESWGGVGSNVYVSLSAANSYITTAIYDSAAWTDATTAQRQAALVEATIQIDRMNFVGSRYYSDQKLEMPRALTFGRYQGFRTTAGTPDSVLQQQMQSDVERATCYQALYVCRNSGRNVHNERIQQGITALSEGVGPVKEFVQYGGSAGKTGRAAVLSQDTLDLLSRWVESAKIWRA